MALRISAMTYADSYSKLTAAIMVRLAAQNGIGECAKMRAPAISTPKAFREADDHAPGYAALVSGKGATRGWGNSWVRPARLAQTVRAPRRTAAEAR
ncbi:MAG: hypothetical protein H6891_08295 [Brucellaceae bacterium]|nr:hypothetical protein [Brucellaceae bacterium]